MLHSAEDVFIYCVALPQFSDGVFSGTVVVSGYFYNAVWYNWWSFLCGNMSVPRLLNCDTYGACLY